jgi:tight adherence protein B
MTSLQHILMNLLLGTCVFLSAYAFVRGGYVTFVQVWQKWENHLDRVLNHQLLLGLPARSTMITLLVVITLFTLMIYAVTVSVFISLAAFGVGIWFPAMMLSHLEQKRREKLESQLVDGITTLASGVRAGLSLIQSMELLEKNSVGPIHQEFAQLNREYQMGLDLNQSMRMTANRIGSTNYRLLFTALEMHRRRGGDAGESLDRIAESIREIQRLEGKLDALTAQGRIQARMMAAMPIIIVAILYTIDPDGVTMLFVEPLGRIVLFGAAVCIVVGFLWIRRIMQVDI